MIFFGEWKLITAEGTYSAINRNLPTPKVEAVFLKNSHMAKTK